ARLRFTGRRRGLLSIVAAKLRFAGPWRRLLSIVTARFRFAGPRRWLLSIAPVGAVVPLAVGFRPLVARPHRPLLSHQRPIYSCCGGKRGTDLLRGPQPSFAPHLGKRYNCFSKFQPGDFSTEEQKPDIKPRR